MTSCSKYTRALTFVSLCQELFKLPGENTVNPVFLAIFGMLGVWPAVMAALLIPLRPQAQSLKAWPFVTASFGTHFSKKSSV